jgi:PHP domain-containing protein
LTTADVVLRGSFSVADERHYTLVPFNIPSGVRSIDVEYEYSNRIASDPRLRIGNTLDIGLFDANGFRGWSGSHKDSFTVCETWATPAYVAGPLAPGTWHILLGPYKVSPHGCEYEVRITFSSSAGEPPFVEPHVVEAVPPVGLRSPAEAGWLRGDLHCHTLYSDGDSWPADMLSEAVKRGLEFLGVTDHNQTGHHAAYAQVQGPHLPLLLPGVEVTTYGGHWNAWGTERFLDFREPTSAAVSRVMQAAAESGALVSVNHPKPFGPPWEYPDATGFHCIEVWNGGWPEDNEISLEWWDSLLRTGRRIVAVGGSDTHRLKDLAGDRPGRPTTWAHVRDDRSAAGVLHALHNGRAFVSRDVDGPQLFLSHDHLRVVGASGASLHLVTDRGLQPTVPIASEDWTTSVAIDGRYVRAEVRAPDGEMLALSNPVWGH